MRAYIHTYMDTYMHTDMYCLHTCIHTCTACRSTFCQYAFNIEMVAGYACDVEIISGNFWIFETTVEQLNTHTHIHTPADSRHTLTHTSSSARAHTHTPADQRQQIRLIVWIRWQDSHIGPREPAVHCVYTDTLLATPSVAYLIACFSYFTAIRASSAASADMCSAQHKLWWIGVD